MGPNSTEVSNFFCRTSPDDTWKDGKNLEPLRNFVEYYFIIIFIIYQTKIYVLQRPVLRYMLKRKERDRKDQQIILYFLLCLLWGNLISTRPFAIFQVLLWEIMFYSNWRILTILPFLEKLLKKTSACKTVSYWFILNR